METRLGRRHYLHGPVKTKEAAKMTTIWLTAERAALSAKTHVPAVDDFGNQYLARAVEPAPALDASGI
jgi:hypothetical protein